MQFVLSSHFDNGLLPLILQYSVGEHGKVFSDPTQLLGTLEAQLGFSLPEQPEVLRALRLLAQTGHPRRFLGRVGGEGSARNRACGYSGGTRSFGWPGGRGRRCRPGWGSSRSLMEGSPPGIAGRVARVIEALKVQEVDLESIELLGMSRGELPVLFRRLLEALEARGTVITETPARNSDGQRRSRGLPEPGLLACRHRRAPDDPAAGAAGGGRSRGGMAGRPR